MSQTIIIAGDATKAARDRIFDCPYCGAKFIGHSSDSGFALATIVERAELGITAKCTCPTCSNVAVSSIGSAGEIPVIVGLALRSRPAKTLYAPGDTFDTTGLQIEARWSNGTTSDVDLTDCTFSPSTSTPLTTAYDKVVATHTANGKTVDITIRVENVQIRKPRLVNASFVYTGSAQAIEVTGFDSATMTRSNYSKTAAGSYTASYSPKTGYCWEDGTTDAVTIPWTIAKATPSVTAPTAKEDLVYTGEAQELVVAGSTTGGTMKYSLDGTTYGTSVPTGTDPGDYTVYYRVDGGTNYTDVAARSLSVSIASA